MNPSGRLPISFPRHSGQIPVYYNALPGWHGPNCYCDLPKEPLFAFGEGLGFSSYTYHHLTFDVDTMTAEVDVTNEGEFAGTETVQVYFRDMVSSIMTPIKQLIAYKQIELAPHETKHISFKLNAMDFSLVNKEEKRVVEPGEFKLMVGHSSKDEDLQNVRFTL